MKKKDVLDELDMKLLIELQKDCRNPLQEIAKAVDAPYSTVHYRVSRLEKQKIISGYSATVNPNKLGLDYMAVISIWTDFNPEFYHKIGKELSEIFGVWAVYNCLGEVDFFVLARASDKNEFLKILDKMMKIKGISRISTHVMTKVVKEDPRLDFDVDFEYRLRRWI
ncbi:MAG: Lrp/AsnC family transcriptional regulator [Candidatus Thorarchaeota archaeon]